MKENDFKLEKARSWIYNVWTIMDADYADDVALLSNLPIRAESLLYSLERGSDGIGLHVNAEKTEYMCFNQRGDMSILKTGLLKLVNKFTYLGKTVSSTDNDINMWLTKAWTARDMLYVIWK